MIPFCAGATFSFKGNESILSDWLLHVGQTWMCELMRGPEHSREVYPAVRQGAAGRAEQETLAAPGTRRCGQSWNLSTCTTDECKIRPVAFNSKMTKEKQFQPHLKKKKKNLFRLHCFDRTLRIIAVRWSWLFSSQLVWTNGSICSSREDDVISVVHRPYVLHTFASYTRCNATEVKPCGSAKNASFDHSHTAEAPPSPSLSSLSLYVLTGCRRKMVNFWLNIMLHNHLAFKLKNGFLLCLSAMLFPL